MLALVSGKNRGGVGVILLLSSRIHCLVMTGVVTCVMRQQRTGIHPNVVQVYKGCEGVLSCSCEELLSTSFPREQGGNEQPFLEHNSLPYIQRYPVLWHLKEVRA